MTRPTTMVAILMKKSFEVKAGYVYVGHEDY